MNDTLSEKDWESVTGIKSKSQDKWRRRAQFLDDAGIYYWEVYGGGLCTTWTHVHKAGEQVKISSQATTELPNFGQAS